MSAIIQPSFCIGNGKTLTAKLRPSIICIILIPTIMFFAIPLQNYFIYVVGKGDRNVIADTFTLLIEISVVFFWIVFGWFRMIAHIWIIYKYSELEGYYTIFYYRNFFVIKQELNGQEFKITIDFKNIYELNISENHIYLATKLKEGQTWPNLEYFDSSSKYRSNWIYRIVVPAIITNHNYDHQLVSVSFDTNSKMTMSDKILLVNSITGFKDI